MTGLTLPERKPGSYERYAFEGSLLQRKLNHAGLFISLSKKICVFRDENARALCDPEKVARYEKKAAEMILKSGVLTVGYNEEICRAVFALRKDVLGAAPFQNAYLQKGAGHSPSGIDQKKFTDALQKKDCAVFYLSEPYFAEDFVRAVQAAEKAGRRIYVLTFPGDPALPDEETVARLLKGVSFTPLPAPRSFGAAKLEAVEPDGALSRAIETDCAALFAYGEEALLAVRKLTLPAEVLLLPRGIPAKAVTGLFTKPEVCRLFVPKGFDPVRGASLVKKTEYSYLQIASLAEKYGEIIYTETPEEWYRRDPGLFFSIYDDHLPCRRERDFTVKGGVEEARRAHLKKKLDSLSGVRYLTGYFDPERFEEHPVDFSASEKQNRILTDGVLIAPGGDTEIFPGGDGALSPRARFFDRKEKGAAVLSNFAFFFTSKLASAYDRLREDRPLEQLSFPAGYVDYCRYTDPSGVRHESFPLYRKACLAGKKGGKYAAFSFELKGGSVLIASALFRWETPNDPASPAALFTPLLSEKDEGRDSAFYRKEVGRGRLNFVFIGERLLCVRKGGVLLPPMGVVLSLNETEQAKILPLLTPLSNGYFSPDLPSEIRLDPPEGISREEWDGFDWVYGGGLGLVDGENEITRENFESWCRREGWLSPLSCQTQESSLHIPARHPRTGVGVTKKGELFILVYSGRSALSLGADYVEMVRIARKMIPGIRFFINWDGGGSSLLALLEGDRLTEISLPSPSDESITGMARPIHSMIITHPKED